MYAYSVYGLTLQSDFPIPELPDVHAAGDVSRRDGCFIPHVDVRLPGQSADAGQPDFPPQEADIVVRRGSIPAPPAHLAPNASTGSAAQDAGEDFGDSWAERWAERNETLCVFADVGRYLVQAGQCILVEPAAQADPSVVRHLLLGPVLAHLLWQREVFTLHASVVGVRGHYAAFVGASGEGKSTTAAAFAARGESLVCDDVAALIVAAGRVQVLPGFPRLRLYDDSVRGLGEDPEGHAQVHVHIAKRSKRIANFAAEPVTLERLYVLASGDDFALEPLPPRGALMEVLRHTYYAHQFAPLYGFQKHLEQAARVVERLPAFRLTRPKDLARLGELVAFVEAHWQS